MPVSFGRVIKNKDRPLAAMAHLKRSVAEVKADNNLNYTSYRDGRKIRPVVRKLLVKTGIDQSGDGGFPN